MPKLSDSVAKRLDELLASRPESTFRPSAMFEDAEGVTAGRGWCVSAASVIAAVVSDKSHPYRVVAAAALDLLGKGGVMAASSMLYAQVVNLQRDLEAGLLVSIETQVSAQTFDDMLDHADAYVRERR